jgi:hypothetical protein
MNESLQELLCCCSSLYISEDVWGIVQNIKNFGNMNWCKFTIDQLRHSASMCKKPGARDRKISKLCTVFFVSSKNVVYQYKSICIDTADCSIALHPFKRTHFYMFCLQMYYLDNLDCKHKMICVDCRDSTCKILWKLKADKLAERWPANIWETKCKYI